ncbi:hypothetical protein ACQRC4_16215 [Lachnospiraceae bacterium SGI.066]
MEITYQAYKEEAKKYANAEYQSLSCLKAYDKSKQDKLHTHMYHWVVKQCQTSDPKKILKLCASYEKKFFEDCRNENFS